MQGPALPTWWRPSNLLWGYYYFLEIQLLQISSFVFRLEAGIVLSAGYQNKSFTFISDLCDSWRDVFLDSIECMNLAVKKKKKLFRGLEIDGPTMLRLSEVRITEAV